MATDTTGSLVLGAVKGVNNNEVTIVNGNPSGILSVAYTSGVAFDVTNGQYYMGLSAQTWIKLGSIE